MRRKIMSFFVLWPTLVSHAWVVVIGRGTRATTTKRAVSSLAASSSFSSSYLSSSSLSSRGLLSSSAQNRRRTSPLVTTLRLHGGGGANGESNNNEMDSGGRSMLYNNRTSSSSNSNNNNNVDQQQQQTHANDSDSQQEKEEQPTLQHSLSSAVLAIDPAEIDIVTVAEDTDDNALLADDSSSQQQSSSSSSLLQFPFVSMFRGSANYIANHRNTLAVYHIPGGPLDENDAVFRNLMNDVSLTWLLGMKVVLVVGCRHQIEKRISAKDDDNDEEQQHSLAYGALRVTDEDMLRIVKEEAGYVRFEVERQLARALRVQGAGAPKQNVRAGSSSSTTTTTTHSISTEPSFDGNVVSGNFYSAQPFGVRDGVDYKFTGFVRRVEVQKIRQVLDGRDICLLTTLGVSPSGEVFNCNSESLAAAVAGALGASKVIYFTDKETELRHRLSGNKIQSLRLSDARNLLKYSDIDVHKKGYVKLGPNLPKKHDKNCLQMLLKIGYGMQALEQGVKRAHIISPKHGALLQELYTRDGSGLLISGDLYEGIRRGNVNDVAGIHDLIAPLIQMGTLVDRPKATLEKDIDNYFVYTRDNHIVACGQLKQFEEGFAEIGCLVVNREYRSRGRGDAMLGYLERLSVENGCTTVFVLSTQTMEWFVERGFEEVGVDRLPPSRQATYNRNRNSKIYMKKIESLRDLDAQELWWNR